MMERMERKNEMEEDNLLGFSFLYQNKFSFIPDTSILIGTALKVFKNVDLLRFYFYVLKIVCLKCLKNEANIKNHAILSHYHQVIFLILSVKTPLT